MTRWIQVATVFAGWDVGARALLRHRPMIFHSIRMVAAPGCLCVPCTSANTARTSYLGTAIAYVRLRRACHSRLVTLNLLSSPCPAFLTLSQRSGSVAEYVFHLGGLG